MTTRLKKIIDDLSRLSNDEQDSFATLIREELSWKSALDKPAGNISKLAKEALKEHREGKTKSKDW